MTMLEGFIPDKITRIHKADTLIVDGMALVQSLLPHSEHLIFPLKCSSNISFKKLEILLT